MSRPVLITVRGLSKHYRMGKLVIQALNQVDLDVHQGEYLSIMGPSGSGKSTLFNMIGALDRPSAGTISVAGLDLARQPPRRLAFFRGRHIGYIFQSFNLIPAYNALDNVALPLIFSGRTRAEALDQAKATLDRVGLGHRLTHRPDELSGGQQQRVAIARALANSPSIILADEPTANLDLQTGEEIIKLLFELCRERGVTVISATHDHKMLVASDRICWIRDGEIDRIETAQEAGIRVGSIT
ncbi:MAG: ABC transporter ATP-binding protein [Puniceicoccaceae bacterium]|nr:MAG: ABC transporter ATP-binding protein [Puniceicoccaceae bacterium]